MNFKFLPFWKMAGAIVMLVLFGALPAFAVTQTAPTIVVTPTFIQGTVCSVVSWMFFILVAVCTIMILWAAILYATAGEDTEKVHKAGQTLLYAAIGIVVALIAAAFPQTIAGLFKWTISPGNGC